MLPPRSIRLLPGGVRQGRRQRHRRLNAHKWKCDWDRCAFVWPGNSRRLLRQHTSALLTEIRRHLARIRDRKPEKRKNPGYGSGEHDRHWRQCWAHCRAGKAAFCQTGYVPESTTRGCVLFDHLENQLKRKCLRRAAGKLQVSFWFLAGAWK